ncbi:transcription factor bHLH111 isoform X5 [Glycine max]|uniref:Transcription factor bHLH111 isoform C n=1 Tax=Glycine soja TaxID=3848 RepID=A0A445IQK3_GLYSO|nr:transcription factor bHLH111 isoform X5 [Glycine max]RZB88244.1 Transcription factor bHLH111 isoform C [Glycine soja]
MTEESAGNTVATSITPFNWWYLQANSLSSWNDTNSTWSNQPNPNSSSSCEEDISVSTSFTNASNHSSLTVESSRRLIEPPAPSSTELMGEHASDNQLWSHVLSGVGSDGELHNSQEIGENFLDALSSKSMTSTMFQPVCDYLKKLDHTSWEYNGSTSLNSFEKHLNGFSEAMLENNERLTKLSNLVSTWSIAPPDPEVSSHFDPQKTNNMSLSSNSMDHHFPQFEHFKQPFEEASRNSGVFPNCYDHDMKVKQEYHASEVSPGSVFGKPLNANGYRNGFNSLSVVDSCKLYHDMPNISSCTRNFSDVISFNSRLGWPVIGVHGQKPSMKYLNVSEPKKQGLQTPSPPIRTNVNGKGEGTTREVKKKRSEESSDAMLKKPKQDTSTASSSKAPKVKLGDKITALQQIVSPFGKTDTASVLFEAIGYIKFLQEQVQLLSNPFLKANSHKDPWGSLDRKDHKEDTKLDLRSRGLCLVPTSCTPLVYRESSGPDYWTPAYRGCLYR